MTKLPPIRKSGLVVQEIQKELLIYDLQINKAYHLNQTSKIVFQACDGKTTFDELKHRHQLTDEIVYLALDQLQKDNFIKASENYVSPFAGMSRREIIKKVGLASMITLPVIATLIAPTAANAQSCQALGATCNQNNGTQSNCCGSTNRCTNTGQPTPTCKPCTTTGSNTNCSPGAPSGCCGTTLSFFTNTCCNGFTEAPTSTPGVLSCTCNS